MSDHDSRDRAMAHGLLRAILGLNIALHGLVRLPKLGAFADGLAGGFADTWLPVGMAKAFAYVLVPAEAVVGF